MDTPPQSSFAAEIKVIRCGLYIRQQVDTLVSDSPQNSAESSRGNPAKCRHETVRRHFATWRVRHETAIREQAFAYRRFLPMDATT